MADFQTLDYTAQVERLDAVAQAALRELKLSGAGHELISYTNNAIYRVDAADARYVLRVHRPGLKRRAWITSERMWLAALWDEANLRVPNPVFDLIESTLEGYDGPVYVDVLHWLSGEAASLSSLTTEQLHALGQVAAKLHDFDFTPPDDFMRPSLDWEGMFGERSPYNPGEGEKHFTDSQREVIADVTKRVREAMDDLGQDADEYGLIHGDLLPKNLLFAENDSPKTLGVLDFDDCANGYYIYDLAGMLWVARDNDRYAEIAEALWEGYGAIRPMDKAHREHLDTFVAARHVASCRWVAGNTSNPTIRDRAAQIIAERVDEMRVYLETGKLR